MEPMIKLENIHQEFDGETILDNINLNIYEGEIVTIIGPSGAGKSTLLRFINLLNRPTSGKIYYLGEDIIQNRKNIIIIAPKLVWYFNRLIFSIIIAF